MKAPFPYIGGKSRIAPLVWQLLGDPPNYVEPFLGSAAVLLARPAHHKGGIETVNDADGLIANFWRALQSDPEAVAQYADWPVNENDLHARHIWLVNERKALTVQLEGNPEWFDAKAAGWWVWGMACWTRGGFCSGKGPWQAVDGQLVHLGTAGQGVMRQLVHLWHQGRGVKGAARRDNLYAYFSALADRLRNVRVCCGDWSRVCGPTPTVQQGLTGVFLDPPYSDAAKRASDCYAVESGTVANDARAWCLAQGSDKRMRIVLCGYEGEHEELESAGWRVIEWRGASGYGGQRRTGTNINKFSERLWASPNCLAAEQCKLGLEMEER